MAFPLDLPLARLTLNNTPWFGESEVALIRYHETTKNHSCLQPGHVMSWQCCGAWIFPDEVLEIILQFGCYKDAGTYNSVVRTSSRCNFLLRRTEEGEEEGEEGKKLPLRDHLGLYEYHCEQEQGPIRFDLFPLLEGTTHLDSRTNTLELLARRQHHRWTAVEFSLPSVRWFGVQFRDGIRKGGPYQLFTTPDDLKPAISGWFLNGKPHSTWENRDYPHLELLWRTKFDAGVMLEQQAYEYPAGVYRLLIASHPFSLDWSKANTKFHARFEFEIRDVFNQPLEVLSDYIRYDIDSDSAAFEKQVFFCPTQTETITRDYHKVEIKTVEEFFDDGSTEKAEYIYDLDRQEFVEHGERVLTLANGTIIKRDNYLWGVQEGEQYIRKDDWSRITFKKQRPSTGTVSYYYRGHLRRIDVVDNLCQTRASVNVDLPNSLLGKREYSIFAEDGENPLTPEDGILCDDVFITEDSVKLVDNEYVAPAPSEGLLEDMEIVAEEAEEADEEE